MIALEQGLYGNFLARQTVAQNGIGFNHTALNQVGCSQQAERPILFPVLQ